jgi:hypothetical protein
MCVPTSGYSVLDAVGQTRLRNANTLMLRHVPMTPEVGLKL